MGSSWRDIDLRCSNGRPTLRHLDAAYYLDGYRNTDLLFLWQETELIGEEISIVKISDLFSSGQVHFLSETS